jgi:hypothetical protein
VIGPARSPTTSTRDTKATPQTTLSTTAPLATHPVTSSAGDVVVLSHRPQLKKSDPLLNRKDKRHGHGNSINTRQQLLDQQAIAADSGTTPRDDRHNDSTRSHQTHNETMEHKRPRGNNPLGQSSIPRWRTQDVFDRKVTHVVDGHGCVRGRQTLGQVE